MPIGLKLQRKNRFLGYKLKYFYYCFARRDILQKKKKYGDLNSHKVIYLIKPDYQDGVEGLLSLIQRQVLYTNYARKRGYIPFVDWKNYKTQYYNGIDNAWEYFFKQPSKISEEEVYQSAVVYLSGWTFKDMNSREFFSDKIFFNRSLMKDSHEILINNLEFNNEVLKMLAYEENLLDIKECIGVYVRGTDYVRLKPSGEFVQPNVEQITQQIYKFREKYQANIFLVTEDGDIYDELKKIFGELIKLVSYDSFIRNYDGKEVLAKSNVLKADKKLRGQEYLVKMILLSKCKYLISSITQGSKFSYSLNGGQYEDEYIFDLGLYD